MRNTFDKALGNRTWTESSLFWGDSTPLFSPCPPSIPRKEHLQRQALQVQLIQSSCHLFHIGQDQLDRDGILDPFELQLTLPLVSYIWKDWFTGYLFCWSVCCLWIEWCFQTWWGDCSDKAQFCIQLNLAPGFRDGRALPDVKIGNIINQCFVGSYHNGQL